MSDEISISTTRALFITPSNSFVFEIDPKELHSVRDVRHFATIIIPPGRYPKPLKDRFGLFSATVMPVLTVAILNKIVIDMKTK
jgi:hypothetical protein